MRRSAMALQAIGITRLRKRADALVTPLFYLGVEWAQSGVRGGRGLVWSLAVFTGAQT